MMPQNADLVVKATVVLHNFLLREEEKSPQKVYNPSKYSDYLDETGNVVPGEWHKEIEENPSTALQRIAPTTARRPSSAANDVRDNYANYFYSETGAVEWQWNLNGVKKPGV